MSGTSHSIGELPQTEQSPYVFISYSHDSPEHKRWVSGLVDSLGENGVTVVFDQYDLRLGEDVPKFMERSVASADRVLMICTENYVAKVDDGEGGAGYEAMIVTGELIADLGTANFIPVIRQHGSEPCLPKCLSTRRYIDFSDNELFDEKTSGVSGRASQANYGK